MNSYDTCDMSLLFSRTPVRSYCV